MFVGLVLQLAYDLERHRLFDIPLRNWLILVCIILPIATWLRFLEAGRLIAALVTLSAVGILIAIWWAGRQRYVRFVDHSGSTKTEARQRLPASPLPAMSKTRIHATGFFEVSGMRRYFVETPADYTTFETREHCIMTQIRRSRFLLVASSDQSEVGWWYTFFQPSMLKSASIGWLSFGPRPRLAVRLAIALPDGAGDEILYLSFDDEALRSLVLDDLKQGADLA